MLEMFLANVFDPKVIYYKVESYQTGFMFP